MRHPGPLVLVLLALLVSPPASMAEPTPSPSPGAGHGHGQGEMHPGHGFSDVERWVKRFEDPAREEWQKPDLVVDLVDLSEGMRVADIGAGTGYFTRRFARAVGSRGEAFAVDLVPGLLAYVRDRARTENLTSLFTVQATPEDPCLPPASMDRIFMCNTLHHVEGRAEYLALLKSMLRPEGRLVVVDYYKDRELPEGPPPEMRLDPGDLARELEAAGFQVERRDVLPYQYILIAR